MSLLRVTQYNALFPVYKEIQPIFNAKCISCHNGGSNGGGLDLRQGSAYNNLTRHNSCDAFSKYVSWFHAEDSPLLQPPYRAGSVKSRLDSILDKKVSIAQINGVQVTDEELRKIRCWIDLGVPQWGTYKEAYSGSEDNLDARNSWLVQEKKNIDEYIRYQATAVSDNRQAAVVMRRAEGVPVITCVLRRSGALHIRLEVPSFVGGQVFRINLYNQRGELVGTLLENRFSAGDNLLNVEMGSRASGQYFIELRSKDIRNTASVVLIR